MSDKMLYLLSHASRQYPQAAWRGDLGYLGVLEMLLHKKHGKKCEKADDLTEAQKAETQHLAGTHIRVKHGVRRVKAWRILRDEFRLGMGLFSRVASATVGLVHLGRVVLE